MKKKLRNTNRQSASAIKNIKVEEAFKRHNAVTLIGVASVLCVITFLVYLPALKNGFVNWDDDVYVYANRNIHSINLDFLKWIFTFKANPTWHPLTLFSIGLDYSIWGLNPLGYHFTNNILHAINTFFVFILIIKLVTYKKAEISKKILIIGAITTIIFSIHPLQVESVAWISERKNLLCTFFLLLSMHTYIKYVSSVGRKKIAFYWGSLILFIFALMSKPMAVSLPIVLIMLDFYPFERLTNKNIKIAVIEKLPFFALTIASSMITVWTHTSVKAILDLPFWVRISVAIRSYILYLIKMVFPYELAPFYRHPLKIDFISIEYLGSFILFVIITFLSIWSIKKTRLFFTIWFYYLITLLPMIGLLQVGGHAGADRYVYLSSLGPFLLIGLGAGIFFERYPKKCYLTLIGMIFVIVIMLTMTIKQISIWRDSGTLWSHEIALYPDTVEIAYYHRGNFYFDMGDYKAAINDYNKAIEINPDKYADAYLNRGNAYYQLGNYQQAIVDYNSAIAIKPEYAKPYNNRGSAFLSLGDYQLALNDFNKSLELDPENADAYDNRGSLYGRTGKYQQAIDDFAKLIAINPQDANTYFNMGISYNGMGDLQQAIMNYSKVIELAPDHVAAHFNRGMSFAGLNRPTEAIRDFEEAIRLNPQYAKAYYNLGMVYSKMGATAKANQNFDIAERLRLQAK